MPKNKNKPNAFYYFMLDWKAEQEKKGCKFHGLKDVQSDPKCSEAWAKLTQEQKSMYKKKCESNKQVMPKMSSAGELLSAVELAKTKEVEFINTMQNNIASMVKEAKICNNLSQHKFYVIHVNYFYKRIVNDDVIYSPAEVGLAEFSLLDGVTRTYSKIVNCKVAVGYACDMKEHSSSTHQIPEKATWAESDYSIIYKEICDFLEPGRRYGKLPPLYTLFDDPDTKYPVLSALNTFANTAVKENDFILYSFEQLFVNIHNININENNESMKLDSIHTSLKIKHDIFDFKMSLACNFHKTVNGSINYCSQSIVQRWIFILCVECCPLFDIDLVPGFHIPIEDSLRTSQLTDLTKKLQKINVSNKWFHKDSSSQMKSPSERTYLDEQERRSKSEAIKLTIVDHSKLNAASKNVNTRAIGSSINLDENNFPSLGSGSEGNRKSQSSTSSYSSHFK